jgi:hypothetical protein
MAEAVPQLVRVGAMSRVSKGLWERSWAWVVLTAVGLVYWVWAGSASDPRHAVLWTFDRALKFSPVPGLGHFWLASGLVIWGLSGLAWRELSAKLGINRGANERDWGSNSARLSIFGVCSGAIILILALNVRLAVLRFWMPLPLDPVVLGARVFRPAVDLRMREWAIVADMATLLILFLGLWGRGRSLWWAALYALHPLVIMQGAANGERVVLWMPLVALAALGWRWQRWAREVVLFGVAAGCVWWVTHVALTQKPFDGLLAACLRQVEVEGRAAALVMIAVEILLQGVVVFLAWRRGWSVAKSAGMMLVAWAMVSPVVRPADVVPIMVLLPLGWTRSGWVLSALMLGVYGMAALYGPRVAWVLPLWLTFLVMMPVWVVAVGEWMTNSEFRVQNSELKM